MSTTSPAGQKLIYCEMHGRNRTLNTGDCFEVKRRAKCTKPNTSQNEADKVSYKDLNIFVNANVTAAFNKAKKSQKKKEEKSCD
eukprot:12006927-Ditylum_brightwellii.AAC.1